MAVVAGLCMVRGGVDAVCAFEDVCLLVGQRLVDSVWCIPRLLTVYYGMVIVVFGLCEALPAPVCHNVLRKCIGPGAIDGGDVWSYHA